MNNLPRVLDAKLVSGKIRVVVLDEDEDRQVFFYPDGTSLAECKRDALEQVMPKKEEPKPEPVKAKEPEQKKRKKWFGKF